jgi:hypothetical protein
MTATAPPTDRGQPDWQSDFLEGAKFAACPVLRQQWVYNKKKRNGLRMKHQYPASSVSRSSISSDFPSVARFRCRMPFKRVAGSGKVFGLNTLKLV